MLQVLVVDDDPVQLRTRQAILSMAGMDVQTATSVESALKLLFADGNNIKVVITDHFLQSGRTGVDLVRDLRPRLPSMPVLVLSGMPGIEGEYDGLNVNIRTKPYPPEELIRDVRVFLSA